jgi:hypothetical protein
MILVDTSVWIQHLNKASERLISLLHDEQVFCHPFVVGELACGNLHNRREVLGLLRALPQAQIAEHEDVLGLLERRRLYGQGLGWVDAHLLASAIITGCSLWTFDKRLKRAADSFDISA